ncbi:MAG: sulfatase-like hydrolase/transferase [Candidatus Hydrogenedentes bacterium]|nr:sulfatase-like hydrolase/transferase [Candidatus Hydrogenedentota bacterium]
MTDLTRRQFVATTAAAAIANASIGNANAQPAPRPNVLFILVDQHRFDCIGAYGNEQIRTPAIDRLAQDGTRYTNSFCAYPVCTPSRYSIWSGRYVHEHGGWSNHCTLKPGTATWPALLREAGYQTAAAGKMHFTPTYLDVGFQRMTLSEQDGEGRWDDDYHRLLLERDTIDVNDLEDQRKEYREHARPEYWETFGALASNLPEELHSTTWTGDRAVEALDQWTDSGNLFVASFVKPHHPFDPPQSWADRHDPAGMKLLSGWTDSCFAHDLQLQTGYFPHEKLSESALKRVMAYYYATIEHIDLQVNRMVEVLKRKGLYENTLIVYTSDHGEYMGYHHMLLKGNWMYDPLIKVPLIIKYPGATQAGQVSDRMVSNVDLAPTILRQCGLAPLDTMRGLDLMDSAAGRSVVCAEGSGAAQLMARTATRKLLVHEGKKLAFLYDLDKDPLETVNVHDDPAYAEDVAVLRQALVEWRGPNPNLDTVLNEQAPQIDQPNVRPDLSHRDAMIAYTREKMEAFYKANSV